jgi:hypothetical protein
LPAHPAPTSHGRIIETEEATVEFSVNSAALTGLADMLDRRWQDYESGRGYLKSGAHFSVVSPGVLNAIFGSHQKIVDEIDAFLATAAEGFAGPSSTAVTEANAFYRTSDRAAMARSDGILPALPIGPRGPTGPVAGPVPGAQARADQTLAAGVFGDAICPGSWYRQPPDQHADHPYRFGFFDAFSPTSYARELIWKATGLAARLGVLDRPYDIVAEAVEPLCGDWAGYLRCADVYDNLAGAVGDTARCVTEGSRTIGRVWTGNAADACTRGMAAFAVDVAGAVDPLHRTAATYRDVAEAVYLQSEAVAALLTLILDEIAESALEPLTGGIEEPFALITEAVDLVRVAGKIREVIAMVAKAHELATATMDSASSALSCFGLVTDRHPVPSLTPAVPALPRRGPVATG